MPSSDTHEHAAGVPLALSVTGAWWPGPPKCGEKPHVAHSMSADACAARRDALVDVLGSVVVADAVLAALGLGGAP